MEYTDLKNEVNQVMRQILQKFCMKIEHDIEDSTEQFILGLNRLFNIKSDFVTTPKKLIESKSILLKDSQSLLEKKLDWYVFRSELVTATTLCFENHIENVEINVSKPHATKTEVLKSFENSIKFQSPRSCEDESVELSNQGFSCDSCLKGILKEKRYNCLECYDYDLCATCYEDGAATIRHNADHPMQCILTRSDLNSSSSDSSSSDSSSSDSSSSDSSSSDSSSSDSSSSDSSSSESFRAAKAPKGLLCKGLNDIGSGSGSNIRFSKWMKVENIHCTTNKSALYELSLDPDMKTLFINKTCNLKNEILKLRNGIATRNSLASFLKKNLKHLLIRYRITQNTKEAAKLKSIQLNNYKLKKRVPQFNEEKF